jgi:hypothetical protein
MDAIVDRVMKKVERTGTATLLGARSLCVAEVRKTGGPGSLGIGDAFVYQALAHEFGRRINSRFRSGMPTNSFGVAMKACPPELIQILPRLHRWIALGEGPNAVWKPSRLATPNDWKTNHSMKNRKAQQTEAAASISLQISKFLSKYGYSSLADVLPE